MGRGSRRQRAHGKRVERDHLAATPAPVRLDLSHLLESPEFRAETSDGYYGSFCLHLLTMEFPERRYRLNSFDDIKKFAAQHPDPSIQVESALETLAYAHELRHFHDCFSTVAGLGLFGYHLKQLKEFVGVCRDLAVHNILWKLPALEWANEPSCPDSVQEVIRRHRRDAVMLRLFMGSFPTVTEDGLNAEPWIDGIFPQYGVVVPLYSLWQGKGLARGTEVEVVNGTEQTVWYAVGFQTLLEGSAQAIQRSAVETLWPKEIAELAWTAFTRSNLPEKPPQDYNVTDYLLTKMLNTQCGIKQFPRGLLLRTTDAALMESAPVMAEGGPKRYPGEAFTHVLNTTDWNRPLAECPRPHLMDGTVLEEMIKKLEGTPNVSTVIAGPTDDSLLPVRAVEAYAHHHIALPLLKARFAEGHALFSNITQYIPRASSLPSPPLTVVGSRVHPLFDLNMYQLWGHYAMLGSLAEQILSGTDVLVCPRAARTLLALQRHNLCFDGEESCDLNVKWRRCNHWCTGEQRAMPNCLFTSWLRNLRVLP